VNGAADASASAGPGPTSEPWRSKLDTGLDWARDDFTPEEREQLLQWYRDKHGLGDMALNQFAEFLLEHHPRGLKRWRSAAIQATSPSELGAGLPQHAFGLMYLHLYCVLQNERGILYSLVSCKEWGRSRAEVLDAVRFSFVTGGPMALNAFMNLSREYLDDWPADGPKGSTIDWPKSWESTEDRWEVDLDQSKPVLSAAEESDLRNWQLRISGEVSSHHDSMSRLHPGAYKALRQRQTGVFEVLPSQMAPLLMLHLATYQVWPTIVRRCVLQARGLCVDRHTVVQTIASGALIGADWKLEAAIEPVREILESWNDCR
jgi:hypothetical protein